MSGKKIAIVGAGTVGSAWESFSRDRVIIRGSSRPGSCQADRLAERLRTAVVPAVLSRSAGELVFITTTDSAIAGVATVWPPLPLLGRGKLCST